MINWENILTNVYHKEGGVRSVTSKKFKIDLINFFDFEKFNKYNVVELGSYCGDTTYILCKLFNKVDAFEIDASRIEKSKLKLGSRNTNVNFHQMDIYDTSIVWPIKDYEVAFIDCIHKTDHVLHDIKNVKRNSNKLKYIIFDDYGAHPDVQKAVNIHQWKKMTDIGYYNELPNYNEEVDGSEGVICEI